MCRYFNPDEIETKNIYNNITNKNNRCIFLNIFQTPLILKKTSKIKKNIQKPKNLKSKTKFLKKRALIERITRSNIQRGSNQFFRIGGSYQILSENSNFYNINNMSSDQLLNLKNFYLDYLKE